MSGTVLDHVKQIVQNRPRCGISGSIEHKASGGKRIGFRGVLQMNPVERQEFVFTGFRYLPDEPETIGVMRKLVKIAQAEDRLILVHFDDQPFRASMVFDPEAFERHGEPNTKDEGRQQRGERWLNLPRQFSCSLRDLADGDGEPRTEELPRGSDAGKGWFDV